MSADSDILGLVMAGGRGSRMDAEVPKPLVAVRGRPLALHCVDRLVAAGVREICFALGHRADEVRRHLEPRLPSSVRPSWIVEEVPRGTIGSLSELVQTGKTVLALNGDLFTLLDLAAFSAHHAESRADLTVAAHEEVHQLAFGELVCDADDRIQGCLEKPTKRFRISSGVYLFEPGVVRLVAPDEALGVPDLIGRAIAAGLTARAYPHKAAWVDVNDVAALRRAEDLYDACATGLDA